MNCARRACRAPRLLTGSARRGNPSRNPHERKRVCPRFALVIALLALDGCAWFGGAPAPIEERTPREEPVVEPAEPVAVPDPETLRREALLAHYHTWAGTPYRHGGTGRNGVDCSGYVRETFRSQFGVDLPRTSGEQAKRGRPVRRDELRVGDLIFFRIGTSTGHVGIYLEDGKFMHASRQRGVMISHLHKRYWRAKYSAARRVLE